MSDSYLPTAAAIASTRCVSMPRRCAPVVHRCLRSLCAATALLAAVALAPLAHADTPAPATTAQRDGQHDFDFNIGTWKTDIRRMVDPFAANPAVVELHGTVTVRPIWGGRAQLEEIEADGPQGHWQGLTLFLYDPKAHQWSQNFVDSKSGELERPMIGSFNNGRGEMFEADTFAGRAILARGVWSDISADAHHFDISYSDDGGKSWHPAFIASLTRIKS